MVRVDRATARAGRGLKGDRYFDQRGTFSRTCTGAGTTSRSSKPRCSTPCSFRSAGSRQKGRRRNIVTRGIDLGYALSGPFSRIRSFAWHDRIVDFARDLESRRDAELAECVPQVCFDRLGAEVEGGGDLSVCLAVGDEPRNFEFASGESPPAQRRAHPSWTIRHTPSSAPITAGVRGSCSRAAGGLAAGA
jgi:hypothetical protein